MCENIEFNRHFLEFLAHNVNYAQLAACLLNIDVQQYGLLREIALNVISEKGAIHVNKDTLNVLHENDNWSILIKLSTGTLSVHLLSINSFLISEISRLALQHYAICQ